MLGNTVVTMRLYATIYPKPCHVRTTGYEDMLTSYAMMLRKLELEKRRVVNWMPIVCMSRNCC